MLRYDVIANFAFTCLTQDTTTGGHLSIFVTRYGHRMGVTIDIARSFLYTGTNFEECGYGINEGMLRRLT